MRDLPAGRYKSWPRRPATYSLNYGQRRPFEQGKPLEIRDGRRSRTSTSTSREGSVIAGRVTDEFGEPVAELMVTAQRYRYFNGRRQLTPVSRPASTDDGGNFRLYGLAPGDYYLSAAPMGFSFGQSSDDSTGYAPTYYPGTASAQHADKVTVGMGDEVSGLQFSLVPTRTAKITGTAMNSRGRPMTGAFVSVIVRQGSPSACRWAPRTRCATTGRLRSSDVTPGEYTIQVQGFQLWARGRIRVRCQSLSPAKTSQESRSSGPEVRRSVVVSSWMVRSRAARSSRRPSASWRCP